MKQQDKIIIAIILAAFIIGGFVLLAILISRPSPIDGKVIEPIEDSFTGNKFVTKIIDGDTVIIEGASVRLLGMDADERGYPCYKEAKKRLEELILNKEVKIEEDGEDKDQYERYLRYIFLNERNINLQLVKEGLAIARLYPQNKKYRFEILEAEKQARKNKIGCKWNGETKEQEGELEDREESEKEQDEPEPDPKWSRLTSEKTGLDVIGACNAGNYLNKEKIVEGKIVATYKSKTNTVFLNFDKPYPNQCFNAVIFSSDLYKFPENLEDYYDGKTVRIEGKIIEYEGRPEIILKDMKQIEVH